MYHVTNDVMSKIAKIVKKSSKSSVFAIFVSKMYTYVAVRGVRVHPGMAFINIMMKYRYCKYLLTKT